jgi:hypothetical protein
MSPGTPGLLSACLPEGLSWVRPDVVPTAWLWAARLLQVPLVDLKASRSLH